MRAIICDHCGREPRQHVICDAQVPFSTFYRRRSFTSHNEEIELLACRPACAAALDAAWPATGPNWVSMEPTTGNERETPGLLRVAQESPGLPAPPHDDLPEAAPRVRPG